MTAREVSEVPGPRDALVAAFREREKESAFCEFSAPLDCEDAANVAIAALRTLLTEHPEAIEALGFRYARVVEGAGANRNHFYLAYETPVAWARNGDGEPFPIFAPPISEEREG